MRRAQTKEGRTLGSGSASADAPALRAYLLGTFRVEIQGRALGDHAWPRKKARQLLKCVLTRPGWRMLKEEAVDLLWPDADPRAAAASLRTTLSALRQALEPRADLVFADQHSLGLRSDADIWTDVQAFEALMAQVRSDDDSINLLEEADALYGGDFLPEDIYEDWTSERREQLKSAWTEVRHAIARRHEQRGDLDLAIAALEQLLAADRCNEPAAQELIRLLVGQGRRAEARRVYQELTQALRDELGVEPLPATLQLEGQITVLPSHHIRPTSSAGRAPTTFACSYPFPAPDAFVGRVAELARIEGILARGRAHGAAVLIGGPAGRGKSTLLGRLARQAERGGVVCLAGAAYEAGSAVPFGPFHDALADWLLSQPREWLRQELGVGAGDLARVVPELRYHLQLVPDAATDGALDLSRVFAAVHAFLRSLASHGPVLLCIEDLHFADAASVQLFGYLARQIAHPTRHVPLVMVGTYRPEDVGDGQLSEMIRARLRNRLELIELPALAQGETAELAVHLLAGPASRVLTEWLHTMTHGSPLFLEQLVLALREEGRLTQRAGLWHGVSEREGAVPVVMRELIGQRFARLGSRCRQTLAVASVLGQTIEHEELVAVLGARDERGILEDLAEALDAQFLHEALQGYVFAHGLVRETIYFSLSTPRRMLLHARAGETLEALGGPRAEERAAALAHHFAHAGSSVQVRSKALHYSLKAGHRAAALSASNEALAHFSRACELIDRGNPPVDGAVRMEALEGRAQSERLLALWPESLATFEQVLAMPEAARRRGHIRGLMAYVYLHMGDVARALDVCQVGLAGVSEDDWPEAAGDRVYLRQVLALILYLQGQWRQVVELGTQMLAEARLRGDAHSLMLAHTVLGLGFEGLGQVAEGIEQQVQHLEAAERTGQKQHIALANESAGFQYYLGGRFATARTHLERALALYREDASELQSANTQQHVCRILLAEGDLETAQESVRLAVELETVGQERWAADGYQILGNIYLLRTQWESAESSFADALRIRQHVGDRRGVVESTVTLGLAHQYRGHWADAEVAYREALAVTAEMDPGPVTVLALRHHGRLCLLMGRLPEAAAELERAKSLSDAIPETLEHAPTLLAVAELALLHDDAPAAVQMAEAALEAARPLEHLLAAHVQLARVFTVCDEHRRARSHAAQAIGYAQRLGSALWLSAAHLAFAQVEVATGSWQAASAAFDNALRQAEAARVPFERALVQRAYSDHLRARRSRPEFAARLAAEAAAIFDELAGEPVASPAESHIELVPSTVR